MSATKTNSCIYEGRVRHRRFTPVEHAFDYRLFMMYVDLDEAPRLFRRRWLWSVSRRALAWLKREDHLGDPQQPLADAVRDLVAERTGRRPTGPIRLLTHLRYFGYCFNPVSFYYCFDAADEQVETIVAEVNNTPWGEQHCYVLDDGVNVGDAGMRRFDLRKEMHVSPFMPMDIDYDWRFSDPLDALSVHMQNLQGSDKLFDATLALTRTEISRASLARVLLSYPLMTARVFLAIHWQALRLWLKRVPFLTHPAKEAPAAANPK
ncbi:MAG: DUF1365 domain-containing protein [Gammaproteobacteria bacterium]